MRISDWSSDVCSSDLVKEAALAWVPDAMRFLDHQSEADPEFAPNVDDVDDDTATVGDEADDADATTAADLDPAARQSVAEGKSVSVRVDLGGRLIINKQTDKHMMSL